MRESSSLSSAPVAIDLYSIGLPESLIAWIAPSIRGWMFSEPGVAMNSATLPDGHQLDDPLAHLDAGLEQVLPDVGEPVVRRVGVVGDHRDAGGERLVRRPVERLRVDEADGDAVGLAGDRGVHGADHLADVRGLGARPLERRVQQRAGVLDPVLRRNEERVRRDVVDEDELVLRGLREVPRATVRAAAPLSSLDLPQAASAVASIAAPPPASATRREIARGAKPRRDAVDPSEFRPSQTTVLLLSSEGAMLSLTFPCQRDLSRKVEILESAHNSLPLDRRPVSRLVLGTLLVDPAVLDEWVRLGGNAIDTARVYGDGAAERDLGAWLASRPDVRDELVADHQGRAPRRRAAAGDARGHRRRPRREPRGARPAGRRLHAPPRRPGAAGRPDHGVAQRAPARPGSARARRVQLVVRADRRGERLRGRPRARGLLLQQPAPVAGDAERAALGRHAVGPRPGDPRLARADADAAVRVVGAGARVLRRSRRRSRSTGCTTTPTIANGRRAPALAGQLGCTPTRSPLAWVLQQPFPSTR